jgi:hypothetical protein
LGSASQKLQKKEVPPVEVFLILTGTLGHTVAGMVKPGACPKREWTDRKQLKISSSFTGYLNIRAKLNQKIFYSTSASISLIIASFWAITVSVWEVWQSIFIPWLAYPRNNY